MASFWYPYLHLQLLTRQHFSKKSCCNCGPERDTRQTGGLATGTEIFEDRISVKYVLGNIECISPMRTVKIFVAGFPEEEPNGAIGIWGFGRELVKE